MMGWCPSPKPLRPDHAGVFLRIPAAVEFELPAHECPQLLHLPDQFITALHDGIWALHLEAAPHRIAA